MLFSTPFGLTTVPPEVLLRQLEAHAAAMSVGAASAGQCRASSECAPPPRGASAKAGRPASPPVGYDKPAAKAPNTTSREVVRVVAARAGGATPEPSPARASEAAASAPLARLTETPTALLFSLDLPGRSQADVAVSIVDGGRALEFSAPPVKATGGRRPRPALCSRLALPHPADRLDFNGTAAAMAAGELLVKIPKVAPAPPKTWRVPVVSGEGEEAEAEKDKASPPARSPVAAPPAAPASDDTNEDGDGSWVEASSDEEGEEEEACGGRQGGARRRKKQGPPPSGGAVLEAVED